MEKEPLYGNNFLRPLIGYNFVTKELIDAMNNIDIQTIKQLYPQLKGRKKEELEKIERDLKLKKGTQEKFVQDVEKRFYDNSSNKKRSDIPSGGRYPE